MWNSPGRDPVRPTLAAFALLVLASATALAQGGPATGVYRLTTQGQPSLCLEVVGSANADGSAVGLNVAKQTSNQQWRVEAQGDGTYKIYAFSGLNSLQMLDYDKGNVTNGTVVHTWEDTGSDTQRWLFVAMGNGYWRIVPKNAAGTAQTLDIGDSNTAGVGSRADVWGYWGGVNQVFHLDDPGAPAILPNPKKGLAGHPEQVTNVHASWVYNWSTTKPTNLPSGVEFVPMTWGYYGNTNNSFVNTLNAVKATPGVRDLLAFNEPDGTGSGQSNMTVASALQAWPYLLATGLPLGSPACVHADDQWMQSFMAGCAQSNYRVDYVTIHWYGWSDPQSFLNYVDQIHTLYNKPVWITEFAPADWSGNHGITPQMAYNFMRTAIPGLNQRSYVRRYSWFSADTTSAALGQSALFNADGSLTPLGLLYTRM